MSAAVGASIPFAHLMPAGLIPAALAQSGEPFVIPGKEDLIVLNDRPINAETPAHLLDDRITPGKYLFVRNNGREPAKPGIDPSTWTLEVGGESAERTATFTIDELKKTFRHYSYQLQIECGGNGRSEFVPAAAGNQWSVGAVGCPRWTGVRLRDVLEFAASVAPLAGRRTGASVFGPGHAQLRLGVRHVGLRHRAPPFESAEGLHFALS